MQNAGLSMTQIIAHLPVNANAVKVKTRKPHFIITDFRKNAAIKLSDVSEAEITVSQLARKRN